MSREEVRVRSLWLGVRWGFMGSEKGEREAPIYVCEASTCC